MAVLHFYDLDNSLVGKTKPNQLKLRKDKVTFVTWKIDAAAFRPGIYRLDFLLNEQPLWRIYFELTNRSPLLKRWIVPRRPAATSENRHRLPLRAYFSSSVSSRVFHSNQPSLPRIHFSNQLNSATIFTNW